MKKYEIIIKGNDTYSYTEDIFAESFTIAFCEARDKQESLQKLTIESLDISSIAELNIQQNDLD